MKTLRLLIIGIVACCAASAQHSNTLTWSWAQGTGDAAAGFHVQRAAVSGGPYVSIATLVGTAIKTYTDNAVVAGQTLYYVITAFNTGGDSVPSNQVTCTTPFQTPTPPSGLSGTVN